MKKTGQKVVWQSVYPGRAGMGVGFVLMLMLSAFSPLQAAKISDRRPNDVYAQVLVLKERVIQLRTARNISAPWVEVEAQQGKAPRHVLQKTIEILAKLDRFRRHHDLGGIAVPYIPGRDITPNEVHTMVRRLTDEVALLLPRRWAKDQPARKVTGKTPNDVYQLLWEISLALDPVLGVQGFSPQDVHTRSLHVLEMVRFLRQSQNIFAKVAKPKRPRGRHSNHSLEKAVALLDKVAQAEQHLWMDPVIVPNVPRRVISPTDVYDTLHLVIAELKRIQFRIGLERNFRFSPSSSEQDKTPDDVVQNLEWAILLMPDFGAGQRLVQFDRAALTKNPNHLFVVTEHILTELERYKHYRGIQQTPRTPPAVRGRRLHHLYQKAIVTLEKMNKLRIRSGSGSMAMPYHPHHPITSNEVFSLVLRIDREVGLLAEPIGVPVERWAVMEEMQTLTDKTVDDVYRNLWKISSLLDVLMGSEGMTPDDMFREAQHILEELTFLAGRFGLDLLPEQPAQRAHIELKQLCVLSHALRRSIHQAKRFVGQSEEDRLDMPLGTATSYNDLFHSIRMILVELVDLRVYLGITSEVIQPPPFKGKRLADIYQTLEQAKAILERLLANSATLDDSG